MNYKELAERLTDEGAHIERLVWIDASDESDELDELLRENADDDVLQEMSVAQDAIDYAEQEGLNTLSVITEEGVSGFCAELLIHDKQDYIFKDGKPVGYASTKSSCSIEFVYGYTLEALVESACIKAKAQNRRMAERSAKEQDVTLVWG